MSQLALLLIDPDAGFRDALGDQLEQEGFATRRVATRVEAAALAGPPTDLILLGPGALDGDGLEGWQPPAPIVALLDDGQAERPNAGIVAYLVRPVRIAELVTLIRRLVRERQSSAARAIGPYFFEPAAKLLRARDGERTVRLTEKEVAMLELLYVAGNGGLSRERLLAEVWGYSQDVTTHTLETHIYRLRRKIERDPAAAQILLTEPGGYRLVP